MDADIKYIAICSAGIEEDYIDVLLKVFYSLAGTFGFKLLIFHSFSSLYYYEKHDIGESNIFHLMNYERIDGIVLLAETIKNDGVRSEIVRKAQKRHIPVVSVDHYIKGCYNIDFKYQKAMEEIVTHLIEHHHYKRINFIGGQPGNRFSDERMEAYRTVLERHGIPVEEKRIAYGGFWGEPTKQAVEEFLVSELPFPEAIVCANDTMAIAVCDYLMQAGYKIPEDVAVTGFDGIPEALEHMPAITTAKHDYAQAALFSFKILQRYFAGGEIEECSWVDSVFSLGCSCGCDWNDTRRYGSLIRKLYEKMADYSQFNRDQIDMVADLTDNDSFQGVFDNLKKYADNFCADTFWLCIIDNFLTQKEALADILEESGFKRIQYSDTMDVMLSKIGGEWLGITDFPTANLVPKLEEILEKEDNIMFLPLHVLEEPIGYVALVYHPEKMHMTYTYQFFMNISNALETTRIHQKQQAIINNLENKYVHDPMTGLLNRRGFYQRLEVIYKQCVEEGLLLMVASVDLNGLKPINDTYGHADGDFAITMVGRTLLEVSRGRYVCARFGGDEFVIAGKIETEEETEKFQQDIAQYLQDFNEHSDRPYKIEASIGCVSAVPEEKLTLDEFIKAADERMYEDKVHYHSRRR